MAKNDDIKYEVGDRVLINTGNADGSIPSLEDYRGTIAQIITNETVLIRADDDDSFNCHIARLTKL